MIAELVQFINADARRCLQAACIASESTAPLQPVVFRALPEHFVVEEIPAYVPSGQGDHLYLWIEKRGISTRAVMQGLCAQLGVHERDIGFAGQKDERAIARQWISVPRAIKGVATDAERIAIDGVRVLQARLHNNKLRLGHLRGNTFTVHLGVTGSAAALVAPLSDKIAALPHVPNLFGAQRFGREGRTLLEAAHFLNREQKARSRKERFWISAVQSALFNGWLADRATEGSWRTPLLGDVLQKTENGAPFSCADPAVDLPRLQAGEVVVGGPLVGAGLRPAGLDALTAESRSWARMGVDVGALSAHAAFDLGARRPASVEVREVEVSAEAERLSLRFSMPKGAYASVALAAWLGDSLTDAAFVDGVADTGPHDA